MPPPSYIMCIMYTLLIFPYHRMKNEEFSFLYNMLVTHIHFFGFPFINSLLIAFFFVYQPAMNMNDTYTNEKEFFGVVV